MNREKNWKRPLSALLALTLWSFAIGTWANDDDADEAKKNRKDAHELAIKLCDDVEDTVKEHCGQTASDCEHKTLYIDSDEACPITVVLDAPHIFESEPVKLPRRNQELEVLGCQCGDGKNYYLVKAPNFCGFMRADALRTEKHPPHPKSKGVTLAVGVETCNVGASKG